MLGFHVRVLGWPTEIILLIGEEIQYIYISPVNSFFLCTLDYIIKLYFLTHVNDVSVEFSRDISSVSVVLWSFLLGKKNEK